MASSLVGWVGPFILNVLNIELGIGLMIFGGLFVLFGVLFFLDRGLLAIGDVSCPPSFFLRQYILIDNYFRFYIFLDFFCFVVLN